MSAQQPTTPSPLFVGDRALVLGGGGSTGNAWLIGVVAALHAAGTDVTLADLIVGTSAGSTAGAQITGADPGDLYLSTLSAVPPPSRGSSPDASRDARPGVIDHLARMNRDIEASSDAAELRRRLSAQALDRATDPDTSERWRAIVTTRLPRQSWSHPGLAITAVDARSAEPVVFTHRSGIALVDAVAASCASGFAYWVGSDRYIDGGYRSGAENADLAAGHRRVLVLAPFGGQTLTPVDWGMHLSTQVEQLRASGSEVEVIAPPADQGHLFGANAMDATQRPAAARVGYAQGEALSDRIASFWR